MTRFAALCLTMSLAGAAWAQAPAPKTAEPKLIPREILFGNPERTQPRLSPDGRRLAWLAPNKKNVLQVWVKTLGQEDARALTDDKKRGIWRYLWAHDNRTLLYTQLWPASRSRPTPSPARWTSSARRTWRR